MIFIYGVIEVFAVLATTYFLTYIFGISVKNKTGKVDKSIRDAAYDKVLGKIREASLDGEVTYLSYEDISQMVSELKKE